MPPSTKPETFLYRIDDRLVSSGVDEFERPLGPAHIELYLSKYKILRETSKGNWIDDCGKRFVLSTARKKFACATIQQAKESFIARKNRQISILSNRLRHAKDAINKVQQREWKEI